MHRVTQALADANINMNTLVTNDSAEFGIIRMLVSDTDAALKCLQAAGYLCHMDTVVAAEIGDECGSLNALLETLSNGNVNLDYLYAQGRVRTGVRNAPRTIDLDLIAFGDLVLDEPDLTIPHPRARERAFVTGPLAEILPDFVWPERK